MRNLLDVHFGLIRRAADGITLLGGAVTLNLGLTLWSFNAFPAIFANPAYDIFRQNYDLLLLLSYGFMLCGAALYFLSVHYKCCMRFVACMIAVSLYSTMISNVFWPHSATAIVTYGTVALALFVVGIADIADEFLGA